MFDPLHSGITIDTILNYFVRPVCPFLCCSRPVCFINFHRDIRSIPHSVSLWAQSSSRPGQSIDPHPSLPFPHLLNFNLIAVFVISERSKIFLKVFCLWNSLLVIAYTLWFHFIKHLISRHLHSISGNSVIWSSWTFIYYLYPCMPVTLVVLLLVCFCSIVRFFVFDFIVVFLSPFWMTNSCLPNFMCVKLGGWGMTFYRGLHLLCGNREPVDQGPSCSVKEFGLMEGARLRVCPQGSSVFCGYFPLVCLSLFLLKMFVCFCFAFGCFFFFQFHNALKVCVSCPPGGFSLSCLFNRERSQEWGFWKSFMWFLWTWNVSFMRHFYCTLKNVYNFCFQVFYFKFLNLICSLKISCMCIMHPNYSHFQPFPVSLPPCQLPSPGKIFSMLKSFCVITQEF